jgi:hypothetical protein
VPRGRIIDAQGVQGEMSALHESCD